MTAQRPIAPKEVPDYPLRSEHSLLKVWIGLKDGTSKTHYAKDCSATVQQLQWRKVAYVVFSGRESMEDCLRIEEVFRKKKLYRTIQIYRRGANGRFPKDPIIKFVIDKDGKRTITTFDDTIPDDVYKEVRYADPEPGKPSEYELHPMASPHKQQSAAVEKLQIQSPAVERSAKEPTKFNQLLRSGSAGKYGFTQ